VNLSRGTIRRSSSCGHLGDSQLGGTGLFLASSPSLGGTHDI